MWLGSRRMSVLVSGLASLDGRISIMGQYQVTAIITYRILVHAKIDECSCIRHFGERNAQALRGLEVVLKCRSVDPLIGYIVAG